MSNDEQAARIERLEERVDRNEDQYREDVKLIHTKLDALSVSINAAMLASTKNGCPAPGSCLVLSEQLKATVAAHNATMLRVERLELRMMGVEQWQYRLFGGVAVLMTLLTLFAPGIRKLFNLE